MPVPDYQSMMLPLLKLIASGRQNVSDCLPDLMQEFCITPEEAEEMLPSGRETYLQNRAHWARVYLAKAGLLQSPRRNHHEITPLGREILARAPERIDNEFLAEFESFTEWRDGGGRSDQSPARDSAANAIEDEQTPEDAIQSAFTVLNATLRDDLLNALQQVSPIRFEKLILDLLQAMGFGGGSIDRARMTKTTGDGGIDGIIDEDALGLDAVYIQAKRYAPENKVGRPDIQRFVGSLNGEGATKGVFVTTSDFSREAQDFLQRVQQRIVLINGTRLTQLMIAHDIGVRPRTTYILKSLDEDYFAENSG